MKYYYRGGQLKSTIPYVEGVADGEAIFYALDGAIQKRIIFQQGREVEK